MILPENFQQHSKSLIDNGDISEVVLRNITRNSYYALFHKLKSIDSIPSENQASQNFGCHEAFIQQLRKCKNQEHKEWGLVLSKLKAVRVKADYKINYTFSEHDATNSFRTVEKTFLKISESKHKEIQNREVEEKKEVESPTPPKKHRVQVKLRSV